MQVPNRDLHVQISTYQSFTKLCRRALILHAVLPDPFYIMVYWENDV